MYLPLLLKKLIKQAIPLPFLSRELGYTFALLL
jgi:hypothetical protein